MEIKKPRNLKELLKIISEAQAEGADVKVINAETGEEGLEGLMREFASAMSSDKECVECGEVHALDQHISKPTTAQAESLLSVVQAHQNPPRFMPGAFVRFREDVQYVRGHRNLHVVVEVLDQPRLFPLTQEDSGSPLAYRRHDCIIATHAGDRGIARYLADMRELEPYPDADKLLGKNS